MLYILEGCDGVGKSTLSWQLQPMLDAKVIHCTSQTPNDTKFFHDIIEASKETNIIADRFMYGQFVYQDEQHRPLSIKQLGYLEAEALSAGVKLIHVRADESVIKERLEARGETLINGLTIEQVTQRFISVFTTKSILKPIEWWTDIADWRIR